MDATQTQRLLEFGKGKLEGIILEEFIKIKVALEDLNRNKEDESNFQKLKNHISRYERFINDFKETYGVEFKDIQERYNKLSSEINKYLQMNNK